MAKGGRKTNNSRGLQFSKQFLYLFLFLLVWGAAFIAFLFVSLPVQKQNDIQGILRSGNVENFFGELFAKSNPKKWTDASKQVFKELRKGDHFGWGIIPLFVLVLYTYASELEKGRWDRIFAGLAFFGMDIINEAINGFYLHVNNHSALWTTPSKLAGGQHSSAYPIFVGWNIEIAFMFLIGGVMFAKILPSDKQLKYLGFIPNRIFYCLVMASLGVVTELFLNHINVLVWGNEFWNAVNFWPILVFGYLHFMVAAWFVLDMKTNSERAAAVSVIYSIGGGLIYYGLEHHLL